MNGKRYHVVVAMKPWVFDDDFVVVIETKKEV